MHTGRGADARDPQLAEVAFPLLRPDRRMPGPIDGLRCVRNKRLFACTDLSPVSGASFAAVWFSDHLCTRHGERLLSDPVHGTIVITVRTIRFSAGVEVDELPRLPSAAVCDRAPSRSTNAVLRPYGEQTPRSRAFKALFGAAVRFRFQLHGLFPSLCASCTLFGTRIVIRLRPSILGANSTVPPPYIAELRWSSSVRPIS